MVAAVPQKTRAKILLVDDEPGFYSRFVEALSKKGYAVLQPRSDEEALNLVRTGQVDLIVHGSNKAGTYEGLCRVLNQEFPDVPSLHFSIEDTAKAHAKYSPGFHEKMRPLAPERELLSVVQRLVKAGRWRRKARAQNEIFKILGKLDEATSHLFGNKLEESLVRFVGEIFGSDEVLFLSPDNLEFYVHEFWKVRSILDGTVESVDDSRAPACTKRMNSDQVSEWVQDITAAHSKVWEGRFPRLSLPGMRPGSRATHVLPVQLKSVCLGYFLVASAQKTMSLSSLNYVLKRAATAMGKSQEHQETQSLSFVDDLTELYNQRYLGMALEKEISRSGRSETPFSVLFIDVDFFKRVNDMRGHLVGSKLLVQISKILKRNIRSVDYGFRYGGDEFLLLLTNTSASAAKLVGERIREEVERHTFEVDGEQIKLTLSIGVATYPTHAKSKEEIIRLADQAMYYGKNKSRNTVFVAS